MLRLALLALLLPSALFAQGLDEGARARAAMQRGEILQLRQILPAVEDRFGGVLLDARLTRRGGGYAYELSLLTRDGRLINVIANAADGRIMDVAAPGRGVARGEGGTSRGPGRGDGDDDGDDGDDDDDGDDGDDGDDD